ncbi:hypothetical protein TTHERM_000151707 (macronuclear) [Tetrahymena thermophila SB210]|uniref:Uncharacterized protein n=1 Tax=Tetrahymena thermophila (strain SB210) TaxID=312017 RepID=W7X1D9_TETTS|nr:hypothetical protein TTHERM_000151707 [Tetrahymena thermophila SB210]EWS73050.1 hypothetical protein TTHERM_000151707 [Tetrahymena thermophila SB210]|eukprot:XP_012654447.1 hypothetical protein TTHERM_000151707 [Tetrahymena thermophila SB210]
MLKRYNSTILNYYEKYFDSIFTLHKKRIIQYVNLSIPLKIKQDKEIKENEGLDWYLDITHQEASLQRNFQDWFTRQFLYSYCDTIVVNFQNIQKAQKIPFESYEDLKLQQLELAYRKANQLLYQLQNKVEGKNKDIYIMCKDLDIQNIINIEFLKTQYTNKYLCIPQTLVNDTFEDINDETEQFMKQNNIKLFPLQHVSSFGITDRLIKSKKYQTILFEDDSFNSKFTDTKYPKLYLPDILLVSASTTNVHLIETIFYNLQIQFIKLSKDLLTNLSLLTSVICQKQIMQFNQIFIWKKRIPSILFYKREKKKLKKSMKICIKKWKTRSMRIQSQERVYNLVQIYQKNKDKRKEEQNEKMRIKNELLSCKP